MTDEFMAKLYNKDLLMQLKNVRLMFIVTRISVTLQTMVLQFSMGMMCVLLKV